MKSLSYTQLGSAQFGPIEPKGSIGKADSGQKLIVSDSGKKIDDFNKDNPGIIIVDMNNL